MDTTDTLMDRRPPTALRPLLGLTVLVVEDSRFACEAMRLLCLRSGARIRRADSLAHARRHLSVYRPTVMIVDLGLPDGSGLDLIHAAAHGTPPIDVILGTSGDTDQGDAVLAAGAVGFIPKPVASLAAFQNTILTHLPPEMQPPGPRLVNNEMVAPDMVAYHDDLSHVAQVLDGEDVPAAIDYVTQFLGGVARSAHDDDLNDAVAQLAQTRAQGLPMRGSIAHLAALVHARLATAGPI